VKPKPISAVRPIQGPNRVLARLEKPLIAPYLRLSRPEKLAQLASGMRDIEKRLRVFSKRMWDWSPKPGTHWCIREVLWHLADSEANYYVRIRRAAAEPGASVSPWDEGKWALEGRYTKQPADRAWAVLKTLREANRALAAILPPTHWKRKVRHPDFGMMTLDRVVGTCLWHTRHHLGQMERRYQEWKNR